MTTTFDPSLASASSGALLPPECPPALSNEPGAGGRADVASAARGALATVGTTAASLVDRRPVIAVVAAAGVGALAGWLIRR